MEKKSSIIAIGLTIHNTPVEIREKLAIPEVSHDTLRLLMLQVIVLCDGRLRILLQYLLHAILF